MAHTAHLIGGPRDGEKLAIVEAKPEIEVMAEPAGDEPEGFDTLIYERQERTTYGAYPYTFLREKESNHENPQD